MTIAEIKSMSHEEQLLAMEVLWDELCHHTQKLESPEWHREILEQRQARVGEGDVQYLTIEELKQRFRP